MISESPTELKRQIKQLKQRVSTNRKKINADTGTASSDLIEQNKRDSAEIKHLERSLKNLLNREILPCTEAEQTNLPAFCNPIESYGISDLRITLVSPTDSAWLDFFHQHSRSTSSHDPDLLYAIRDTYDHSIVVLLARERDVVVGALPLMILDTPLFGRYGASIPYFNYGGPLTLNLSVAEALLNNCRDLLASYNLKHILVRTCIEGLPFTVSADKASMILPLPESRESLDLSLGAKVRSQIKKAGENAFTFKIGDWSLLDDFHQVLSENMRDLGSPFHGKALFSNMFKRLGKRCTIAVAYLNNKPVSAGLLLGNGSTLEIPWASTTKKGNQANANMWFYHQVLTYAISEKFKHFDFGRSSIDAGTFRFKKQWGAVPVQHYWYNIEPGLATGKHSAPKAAEYNVLIEVWRRLPIWLTRVLGERIIKGIA